MFCVSCVMGFTQIYSPDNNSMTIGNTVIEVDKNFKYLSLVKGKYKVDNIDDPDGSNVDRYYHIFVENKEKINKGVCILVQQLKNPHHYIRKNFGYSHVKQYLRKGEKEIDGKKYAYVIIESKSIPTNIYKKIQSHGLKFSGNKCVESIWLRRILGQSRWVDIIYIEGVNNCDFPQGAASLNYKVDELENLWNNFNNNVKIYHK